MMPFGIPTLLLRVSGVASMLAGILLVTGFVLHPAGEDATFGADPLWIPAHAALWAAFTIALVGWVGLYIAQASKAGVLGAWAFVVILLGTSLASWIFSSDVMYVPTIAVESPGLFGLIVTDLQRRIVDSWQHSIRPLNCQGQGLQAMVGRAARRRWPTHPECLSDGIARKGRSGRRVRNRGGPSVARL